MSNKKTYEDRLDHKFELVRSQTTNSPLNGILSGVFEQRLDDGSKVFCAQVDYGPYSVIIPEDKFKNGLGDKDRAYVRKVMESRLGTRVYFITEQFDDETGSAVGNSVTANEVRKKFWFKTSDDGEFEMRKDKEVTGDIVAIQVRNLIVNVSGVETFIPAKDATYKRESHLGKVFTPGDSIKLKLIEVFRDEDGGVKFVASHKIYEENPAIKHYDKYIENSTKIGTVTGLRMTRDKETNQAKGFMVYVQTSDDVTVQCYPPIGVVPQQGQQMSFILLKKKKTEQGVFMLGKGLHVFR